jgi:diaminohydroxyphosphoribosylaminopyrimidine deaminase/5-amino-6-(5-phosphoribosylamino)uracil reductase
VRNDTVIAEGWHQEYGGLHAEAHALKQFDGITEGAVIYVTLEPCSHHGKQPPCTSALLASGIRTVVIGMSDPNPLVSGGGANVLRSSGIKVITDVCRGECTWINRFFTTWVTKQRAYTIAKIATTSDGCGAATTYDGRWITSLKSRERVHALRSEVDCVLTGIGTVRADDPELTVRLVPGRNPARAILDTNCSLSANAAIVRSAGGIPTFVVCSREASTSPNSDLLRAHGCQVLPAQVAANNLDLHDVMHLLAQRGMTSIMIEAGPTVTAACMEAGIIDEVEVHVGPGTGDETLRWPSSCIEPPDTAYQLHHETPCDGDVHRIYTRVGQ